MIELKPCPFCGGEVTIERVIPTIYVPVKAAKYSVCCHRCDLLFGYEIDLGGDFGTKKEAAEAWNRRTKEAPNG